MPQNNKRYRNNKNYLPDKYLQKPGEIYKGLSYEDAIKLGLQNTVSSHPDNYNSISTDILFVRGGMPSPSNNYRNNGDIYGSQLDPVVSKNTLYKSKYPTIIKKDTIISINVGSTHAFPDMKTPLGYRIESNKVREYSHGEMKISNYAGLNIFTPDNPKEKSEPFVIENLIGGYTYTTCSPLSLTVSNDIKYAPEFLDLVRGQTYNDVYVTSICVNIKTPVVGRYTIQTAFNGIMDYQTNTIEEIFVTENGFEGPVDISGIDFEKIDVKTIQSRILKHCNIE